jgi:sodium/potassium-transporting ATPase subunit alpha
MILAYLQQMANLFTLVLLICGVLSIVVFIIEPSYWINLYTGLLFWFVAFFNAAIESWQSYSSQKTLEGFLNLVPSSVLVIRNGQIDQISATELVVGDLILIKTGNKIPADGRLIYSNNVRVDNSSLTGESEPQERNTDASEEDLLEAKCMVFSGTVVISGDGIAVIVQVGASTVIGRLAAFAIAAPKRTSQLEREMTIFFRRLVLCAFFFGITGLILAFSLGGNTPDALSVTIGIFVSFLPQGLPATMTILLTTAAKRMARRNVLVKDLRSVETLGAMTLLATDKTGTLTQNKMAVVGGWVYGKVFEGVEQLDSSMGQIEDFMASATLCTSCKLDPTEKGKDSTERSIFGDATEVGILQHTGKFYDLDTIFDSNERILEIPFSSATKWHLTIYRLHQQNHFTVLMKGAPERVIAKCQRARIGEDYVAIDQEFREEFERKYEHFAANGLRILAVARRDLPTDAFPLNYQFDATNPNFPTDGLDFLGFICLRDPPKPGVSWAVGRLRSAGIMVVMVTGDHAFTAEAIARQVGIITETEAFKRPPTETEVRERSNVKAVVLSGDSIEAMTRSDWMRLSRMKEIVFARTAPRHKLEIVKQFQAAGHIVAVSGDGVNDSPALQKANLGISMNKTASDVSKDAAHMILLDDNFVSIVAGVFEGRLIYENVKKSIRYTLSHIPAEVSLLLLYSLLFLPLPLTPILLIFIDVFAEIGPAVSFAGEPPEFDLMKLPPRHAVEMRPPYERRLGQWLRRHHYPRFLERITIWIASLFHLESHGETLVDFDLVCWAFFEGGLIIALGAWGAYILALVANNVSLSTLYRSDLTYYSNDSPPLTLANGSTADAQQQLYILGSVQAATYLAILIGQWFNIFMQKHRYRYPYGWDMLINWMTYVGLATAMFVAACVCFIPGLNYVFETHYPPALALAAPFVAGISLVVYEFVRKYLRHHGFFGGIPSKTVLHPPPSIETIETPPIPRSRELSIVSRQPEGS